jgi:hypothetical protein
MRSSVRPLASRFSPLRRLWTCIALLGLSLAVSACDDDDAVVTPDARPADAAELDDTALPDDAALLDDAAPLVDAPVDATLVDAAWAIFERGGPPRSCDTVCAEEGMVCVADSSTPAHRYLCQQNVVINRNPRPCATVPASTYESGGLACNFWYVTCTCTTP